MSASVPSSPSTSTPDLRRLAIAELRDVTYAGRQLTEAHARELADAVLAVVVPAVQGQRCDVLCRELEEDRDRLAARLPEVERERDEWRRAAQSEAQRQSPEVLSALAEQASRYERERDDARHDLAMMTHNCQMAAEDWEAEKLARERAEAALGRVRDVHRLEECSPMRHPVRFDPPPWNPHQHCSACGPAYPWPCPTVAALDGTDTTSTEEQPRG